MRSLRPTTLRVSTAAVLPARPTAPLCNASSESALPDLKRIVRPDRAVRPALVPCSDETRLDQAEGDLADDILWHGSTVATGCQLQVGRPSPFAGSVSVTQATMGRKLASPCVPSTLAQSKTLSPKSWGTNALQSVCGRTTSSTEDSSLAGRLHGSVNSPQFASAARSCEPTTSTKRHGNRSGESSPTGAGPAGRD